MKQLFFDFMNGDIYNLNNFIVFNENKEAYYFLNKNKEEENPLENQLIFLSGDKKCGKTHLGIIWKQKHNAKKIVYREVFNTNFDEFSKYVNQNIEKFDYYLLDDLEENFDENKFFYLLNTILNNNSTLLTIGNFNVLKHKFKIKDLKSRIYSGVHLKIKKLSKEIKTMLIIKLFADKQISPSGEVLKYLTKKLKTDYEEIYTNINTLVDDLEEDKNRLSLNFVKKKIER